MHRMTMAAVMAAMLAATGSAAAGAAIPPPVYDFCGAAVAVVTDAQGHAAYAGDTCDGDNQVLDHQCDGFATHNGREDYYRIDLDVGDTLSATVAHAGDAVLMVTAECIAFGTMFTCLAGADAAGPGGVETISYANYYAQRTVYLVVDSHTTAGCGAYTLDLSILGEVATQGASFGAVKAAYR